MNFAFVLILVNQNQDIQNFDLCWLTKIKLRVQFGWFVLFNFVYADAYLHITKFEHTFLLYEIFFLSKINCSTYNDFIFDVRSSLQLMGMGWFPQVLLLVRP